MRTFCTGDAVMRQERASLAEQGQVDRFEISDDSLTLEGGPMSNRTVLDRRVGGGASLDVIYWRHLDRRSDP
jgi:hypothetical protein